MFKLLIRLVYTATTLIEALIMARIILSIINANVQNTVVGWIMNTSDIFVKPFEGITTNAIQIDRFTLSLTPLIALVFFMIAAFILSELLRSFSRD
ncbi:YggT family protein [Patescibacteria group bacterium]|nr:YggT family protein [Patescibacteria group bacterium]